MSSDPAISPAYRIETQRLVVRCWQPADAPLLKEAVDSSLEHLRAWLPWAYNEPTTLDQKVATLRRFRGLFDLGTDFVYGIFDRQESRVLGGTGLHTRSGDSAREIGYWIRLDSINQGFAGETAAALTRVGFAIEKLQRIEIHVDVDNLASAAVPRKLGYQHEATLKQRLPRPGTQPGETIWRDVMIWSLFASSYPTSPSARLPLTAYDAAGGVLLKDV